MLQTTPAPVSVVCVEVYHRVNLVDLVLTLQTTPAPVSVVCVEVYHRLNLVYLEC